MKALTAALLTGKSTRSSGVQDRSEMALDTHLCLPVVIEKGPVLGEAIGYGGFVEPGDCVPSFLRAEVSEEKQQEG